METVSFLDTVYLHITKACNLDCVYCYFSAGEPMENELSTKEMLAVLEDVPLLSPRRIVFTGGEPLLRNDVLKLVQALKNMRNEARLCITTNGTLITGENALSLVENFDEIRISIDGSEQITDIQRGQGTFKKAMNAFRCIIDAGGDPIAFITVTSLNLLHLQDFMHFLLSNGIFKIHLSPLKIVGRAEDTEMLCDTEEIQKVAAKFWHETFGLQLKTETKKHFNCGVGKFLTVYPNGAVYPCHLLAFPEFCIGNVKKQRLTHIYTNSTLMNKLRTLHFDEISRCAECFTDLAQDRVCLGAHAKESDFRKQLLHKLGESKPELFTAR